MRTGRGAAGRLLVACAALTALPAAGSAAEPASARCPPRSFPGVEWPSRAAEASEARAREIAALEAYAFRLEGADAERRGIRTDAVLVVQGGAIVYERYARGFDAQRRHLAWSVSKSLTDALAGVAVHEGLLSPGDSVCRHLAGLPAPACAVRVEHLLRWESGLDWKELYENEPRRQSSVLAMLYGQGQADMGRFAAGHPLREAPGTTWAYSSGDSNLLAEVIGRAMAARYGPAWPWPALLDRIGARRTVLERDGASTFDGASHWYATARDAARLGYLYLADGCWERARLLPEGWVSGAARVGDVFRRSRRDVEATYVPGRGWWLNVPVPEAGIAKPFPSLPDDLLAARGHWGQSIAVFPSLDLVVVRFADDRDRRAFDFDRFHALAVAVGTP